MSSLVSRAQTAWRRFRGLRIARTLLTSVVSKTLDESTGGYYYFNSLTGETSWEKPTIFGSQAMPIPCRYHVSVPSRTCTTFYTVQEDSTFQYLSPRASGVLSFIDGLNEILGIPDILNESSDGIEFRGYR